MGKQDECRFNLKFDESDEDHRRVSAFLNSCGRKKARYVVKAVLAYWALQEGRNPILEKSQEERNGRRENILTDTEDGRRKDRLIQVNSSGTGDMDQEEAELMRQNYAMFEDME
jgi:hypothetical protein